MPPPSGTARAETPRSPPTPPRAARCGSARTAARSPGSPRALRSRTDRAWRHAAYRQVIRTDMTTGSPVPPRLRRSNHISWFGHMGAVYLFHDLYGYLMQMSPDIADMIEAFSDGVDTQETLEYFQGKFDGAEPREMVDVLVAHAVLVDPAEDE